MVNNPKTPPGWKNLDALGKVDVILVTHGHGDHTGDVAELQKRTGATVLGPAGLVSTMVDLGLASEMTLDLDVGRELPNFRPKSFALTERGRTALPELLKRAFDETDE